MAVERDRVTQTGGQLHPPLLAQGEEEGEAALLFLMTTGLQSPEVSTWVTFLNI